MKVSGILAQIPRASRASQSFRSNPSFGLGPRNTPRMDGPPQDLSKPGPSRPRSRSPPSASGFGMSNGQSRPARSTSPPYKRSKMASGMTSEEAMTNGAMSRDANAPGKSTVVEENPTLAMFTFRGTKKEAKRAKKKQKYPEPEPYSSEDVLWHDVKDLLGDEYVQSVVKKGDESEWSAPEIMRGSKEVTLRVTDLSVSGDALALYEDEETSAKWVVVVPFAHPGDLVKCVPYKHFKLHSQARLAEIVEYDESHRGGEGDRRKYPGQGCQYFGKCGGCQLQPIPYEYQLIHKRKTVEKAYRRFSHLEADIVPTVRNTLGSPKQWKYRTKITPHFDAPPKRIQAAIKTMGFGVKSRILSDEEVMNAMKDHPTNEIDGAEDENGEPTKKKFDPWQLTIGFNHAASSKVLDIEECPIATDVLNKSLVDQRKNVKDNIMKYERGATLLLRDSLPTATPSSLSPFDPSTPIIPEDEHITITDHKKPVYERVGNRMFTFTAGSFFQNNNSILPSLAEYVREAIFPADMSAETKKPTHLVDAYCGSGFFGISLSDHFEGVAGVELDIQAVEAAKKNATINGLEKKTTWLCGQAEEIFADLPRAGFKGEHSCVVVDPPRKGCDEQFLRQLFDFRPLTVVYVSCNVHTQARDIGWFIHKARGHGINYNLESVRGFDLFPQTAHVESVAVLRLIS